VLCAGRWRVLIESVRRCQPYAPAALCSPETFFCVRTRECIHINKQGKVGGEREEDNWGHGSERQYRGGGWVFKEKIFSAPEVPRQCPLVLRLSSAKPERLHWSEIELDIRRAAGEVRSATQRAICLPTQHLLWDTETLGRVGTAIHQPKYPCTALKTQSSFVDAL
jgi:hypothetical protein